MSESGIIGSLPIAPTTTVSVAPEHIAEIAALLSVIRDAIPVPEFIEATKAGQQIYARVYLNSAIRSLNAAAETLRRFRADMQTWGVEFVSELIVEAAPNGAKE